MKMNITVMRDIYLVRSTRVGRHKRAAIKHQRRRGTVVVDGESSVLPTSYLICQIGQGRQLRKRLHSLPRPDDSPSATLHSYSLSITTASTASLYHLHQSYRYGPKSFRVTCVRSVAYFEGKSDLHLPSTTPPTELTRSP